MHVTSLVVPQENCDAELYVAKLPTRLDQKSCKPYNWYCAITRDENDSAINIKEELLRLIDLMAS